MSGKSDLRHGFTAMADAMTQAPAPRPLGARNRWNSAALRAGSIGRNSAAWRALPAEPVGADVAVTALAAATDEIGSADYASAGSVHAALGRGETALAALEDILG